jgi:hypothetical protein
MRRTPYQVPGQDLRQLTHFRLAFENPILVDLFQISERNIQRNARFFAYLTEIVLALLEAGDCHGLIAPSLNERLSLGTTRPKSTPMTRPKPRQVSQAPSGELKENIAGVGSE